MHIEFRDTNLSSSPCLFIENYFISHLGTDCKFFFFAFQSWQTQASNQTTDLLSFCAHYALTSLKVAPTKLLEHYLISHLLIVHVIA